MIRGFQFTLYDLFGYLLPGLVALGALGAIFWAIVAPHHAVGIPAWSSLVWLAVVVVAYVTGHLLQAATTISLARWRKDKESLERRRATTAVSSVPPEIRSALGARAGSDTEWAVFSYCDALVLQKGNTSDRDIFEYREGFYRGMMGAFVLAILGLLVRWWRDGSTISANHNPVAVPSSAFALVLVVLAIGVWLNWNRYRRFAELRFESSLWGGFALVDPNAGK